MFLVEMETPIWIFYCHCFCNFYFIAINIVNRVLRNELLNTGNLQNHHRCPTLNSYKVILQIQIHSLIMDSHCEFSIIIVASISASLFEYCKYKVKECISINENIHKSITAVQHWTFQSTSLNTNMSIVSRSQDLNPPLSLFLLFLLP